MKPTTTILAAMTAALATAAPTKTLHTRQEPDSCGQWDIIETGSYTLYNNLWGQDNADSGSQCFGLDSFDAATNTLAWHTTWSWSGGQSNVKSYPNIVVDTRDNLQVSEVASIDTTFDWTYAGDDVVANVAYDVFTSSEPDGEEEFELMVWLAALGSAGPISSNYGADGNPVPIATTTIAGVEWNLYEGPNSQMTVYSFLPSDRSQQNSFSGDLMDFYNYLIAEEGFSSSQYVISVGAGTETFTGSNAEFEVSAYTVDVQYV